MKKRQYLYVFIVLLIFITYTYISQFSKVNVRQTSTYDNKYFISQIQSDNKIEYSGSGPEDILISSDLENYGITGLPYINYQITDLTENGISNVYNVFKLTDLSPNSTYTAKVSLNTQNNNDKDTKITFTSSTQYPETSYDKEEKFYNVVLENDLDIEEPTFNMLSTNKYLQANFEIETNNEGTFYLILKVSSSSTDNFDYNIGQLKVNLVNNGTTNEGVELDSHLEE